MKVINHDLLAPLGMVGLAILAGAFLITNKANADNTDVVDQVNITVPTSCTMSGTGMNSHTANINNNTYTPNIGTTTLHAFCNDNEGFAIYTVGYTDDEFGKNVLTSSTLGNTYDIVTGIAESGSTSNWAMKLSLTQDSGDTTGTNAFSLDNGFGSYHNVPAEYTKAAHKNSATDMTANTGGVKLTTTYAAFISKTQPAGTYVGQVKYTLVHPANEIPLQPQPAAAGKIVYHPNGGNTTGTMADQSAGNNASVLLYPSNFSRQGYGFAGWSTTYDYSDPTGFYGPNEVITTPADTSTNGLSLYAIWVKSTGIIQHWSGCSSLTSGSVTALSDQRDNNTYAVAKLADGNCWMIENMRLDNTNTDNAIGALAQGYGASATYGDFSGLANPESPWANNITTANSLYSTDGADNTINIGTYNADQRFPRYNNQNTSSRASTTTYYQNIYSHGNYYTWHAAIADTTAYTTNNQSVTSTSICPSGWRLPKGGQTTVNATAEFYVLGKSLMKDGEGASIEPNQNASGGYGYYDDTPTNANGDTASIAFRKYPNNFVYSGYVTSGWVHDHGASGYYWSSTAVSSNYAYYLRLGNTGVHPGTGNNNKYDGKSIRCLASGA